MARLIRLSVSVRIRTKSVWSRWCDIEMVNPRCVDFSKSYFFQANGLRVISGFTRWCPNWNNRPPPPVHCPLDCHFSLFHSLSLCFLLFSFCLSLQRRIFKRKTKKNGGGNYDLLFKKFFGAFNRLRSLLDYPISNCFIAEFVYWTLLFVPFAAARKKWTRTRRPAKPTSTAIT